MPFGPSEKHVNFQLVFKKFNDLTLDELYRILDLRITVFMREQNCLYPETDYYDQDALHLFAINKSGVLIAYARILPPHTLYHGVKNPNAKIGRVVVDQAARGRGLSYLLLEKALSLIKDFYSSPIELSAQAHLVHFYQKLGFIQDSEEYLEDGIPHIRMKYESI